MATALGNDSYIGLGAEGTYGTAVARTLFELQNSEGIKPTENKVESRSLYRVARDIRRRAQGRVDNGGNFSFDGRYSSRFFTTLLQHTFGASSSSSSQPDVTTAPTAYRHTFTPQDTLPTGLSVEVSKDVLSHLHTGVKVASLSMRMEQNELLEVNATVIGRETTSIAQTPLTFTDGQLIVCNNVTWTWNGVSQNVIGGEFMIDNPITRRNFMNSRYTSEPLRNGKRRVSGSFRVDFSDAVIYSDFRNATERVMVITLTGDTIAGAYAFEMLITMNVTELQDAFPQADNEGPLVLPVNFDGFIDSGNTSEVTLRVTNENSAV